MATLIFFFSFFETKKKKFTFGKTHSWTIEIWSAYLGRIIWSLLSEWTLKEVNCKYWFLKWSVNLGWAEIIPIIWLNPQQNREFKTADKVECIGFLLGAVGGALLPARPEPPPVMAVQFYQITEEISSEAKNEMNCDFESGSLLLSRQKSSVRGPGLSIISGHFITALHTGPNCYKQSGPFLSHPGVECEGQFDRLLTCPGLSHYHLRGLLKGSKSHPLVCYPSSTFCIMRAFIAHLIPSAGKSVIFFFPKFCSVCALGKCWRRSNVHIDPLCI